MFSLAAAVAFIPLVRDPLGTRGLGVKKLRNWSDMQVLALLPSVAYTGNKRTVLAAVTLEGLAL